MTDIVETIRNFNSGRDPERLQRKFTAMRSDPFIFLRGTCHLFYQRLPEAKWMAKAPVTWTCGDLHLGNLGSYKGDNRLVYFDLNDFDEAVLAPCSWEIVRLLASIRVASASLDLRAAQTRHLCNRALDAYVQALQQGKARWIERDTADGMVGELLQNLRNRSRVDLLDSRTKRKGKKRHILVDGHHALPATDAQREKVAALIHRIGAKEHNPRFYRVLDVARRIAGTGSLGVDRYSILVEGKGSPDSNYLLDLKQALPSSLLPSLPTKQPKWNSEAERVVTIQRRMQANSPAFLRAVNMGRNSYILRGLQPTEDRVALEGWNGKLERLEGALDTMGRLAAWSQLRSGGRQGSATADELIAFAEKKRWPGQLADVAEECAERVQKDWKVYSKAYDKGAFGKA